MPNPRKRAKERIKSGLNKDGLDHIEEARKGGNTNTAEEEAVARAIRRMACLWDFMQRIADGSEITIRRADGTEEKIHFL
jgi:hypothetical protein